MRKSDYPLGSMSIAMCPECGELQITVPTTNHGHVTVGLNFQQAVGLTEALVKLVGRFADGEPLRGQLMPIACCEAPERRH